MLRGSLTDLAIVDLVQIPLGNRKTGELLIATEDKDARLYYVEGQLVHLVSGDIEGPKVLDLIVGWSEGEFEFRPDVLTDGTSFEGDLSPKLLTAVDNLKEVRALDREAGKTVDKIRRLLFDFLSDNDYAIHACLMYGDGTMDVCGAERVDTPAWLETLRSTVLNLVASHPRRQLSRVMFEDGDGLLVVNCFPDDGSALLVVAKQGATLGAVSMGVDRLARKIGHVKRM